MSAADPKAKAKAKPKAKSAPAPAREPSKEPERVNSKEAAAKAKAKVAPKVADPAPKAVPKGPTRAELVRGVFDTYDRDCDDLLNPVELRAFADAVGFEGDEADWVDWYRDTCAEVGANRKYGVDRAQFLVLTKDADDEDLQRLCGKRKPQIATKHSLTLRMIFDLFDRDRDGFLSRVELRRFWENLEFEGTVDEWADKYEGLCRDVGADPTIGVDRSKFGSLAERNATDGELDLMLQDLDVMADMVIAVDVWSKLQPKKNGQKFFEVEPDANDEINEGQVQRSEPPPPQFTETGRPLKPPDTGVIAQKKRTSRGAAASLDVDESELDHLRKLLAAQKPVNGYSGPRLPAVQLKADFAFTA